MEKVHQIEGLLSKHRYGCEGHVALFVSSVEEPLAEYFEYQFQGKLVSVSYYITDKQCTKEEAQEDHISKTLGGKVDAGICARYSDITGYLWTDEEMNIGGHDLLCELESYVGKWLILTVVIHNTK